MVPEEEGGKVATKVLTFDVGFKAPLAVEVTV